MCAPGVAGVGCFVLVEPFFVCFDLVARALLQGMVSPPEPSLMTTTDQHIIFLLAAMLAASAPASGGRRLVAAAAGGVAALVGCGGSAVL